MPTETGFPSDMFPAQCGPDFAKNSTDTLVSAMTGKGRRLTGTYPVVRSFAVLGVKENRMTAAALLLVVEDDPLILTDLEVALEEAGFELVTASDAKSAMAMHDERHAEIRAVLTDIRLGDGPTGWDVARHARASIPTMPIVYVSGDSSADWAVQGVPNSVMISKPYAFAQIVTALATLMNAPDQIAASSCS